MHLTEEGRTHTCTHTHTYTQTHTHAHTHTQCVHRYTYTHTHSMYIQAPGRNGQSLFFYHCSYMAVDCTSLQVLIMITLHVINAVSNLGCVFLGQVCKMASKGLPCLCSLPILAAVCLVYRFGMTH